MGEIGMNRQAPPARTGPIFAEDVRVIVLPDGFKIPVPPGEEPQTVWVLYEATSVGEGICPVHRARLHEPAGDDPRPWCGRCLRWWWAEPEEEIVGWELMYDPHEGRLW